MQKSESLSAALRKKGTISEQRRLSHDLTMGYFKDYSSVNNSETLKLAVEQAEAKNSKLSAIIVAEAESMWEDTSNPGSLDSSPSKISR